MGSAGAGTRDHAGVHLPPPLIYTVIFLAGLGLHAVAPLPAMPGSLIGIAGMVLTIAGLLLGVWSIGLFRKEQTSVIPIRPSTTLVIRGPYRWTRNPMYVGLALVYLGVALSIRRVGPLLLFPLLILTVQRYVIRKEEQYLEHRFGGEFRRYAASVRRWI